MFTTDRLIAWIVWQVVKRLAKRKHLAEVVRAVDDFISPDGPFRETGRDALQAWSAGQPTPPTVRRRYKE